MSETLLQRDLAVESSLHGMICWGRSQGQIPAQTGSPVGGGGCRGCNLGPRGAPAQHPLAPTGHAQPKATSNRLIQRADFQLVLFPSKTCRISIAAQAAALRVTICFEKLKQQQLSFSRDWETRLQMESFLGR